MPELFEFKVTITFLGTHEGRVTANLVCSHFLGIEPAVRGYLKTVATNYKGKVIDTVEVTLPLQELRHVDISPLEVTSV